MKKLFSGVIPAMVTPYREDGRIDTEAIEQLVERLIENGVAGLFVCGSSGEWWLLTEEERMQAVEAAVKAAAGRVPVMAHIGANATGSACRLANHAEKAGADAVSALPPIGRPYPPDAVWEHFRAIADSTGLPLYLYHLPQIYGDLITMDRFVQALEEIPTLAGAKFSSYRIDDLIDIKLRAQGRLNIISGCGEQLLSAMANGADGSICTWYNIIPRLGNKIIECVKASDIPEASRHQDILVGMASELKPNALGFAKKLLTHRGVPVGNPRRPCPGMDDATFQDMLRRIEPTGVMEWVV